jgi:nucleosome assembly protein 1-like 1
MLEVQAAKVKYSPEEQAEIDEANAAHEPVKVDHLEEVAGIPDFWLMAVKNNEMLMAIIKEKDTEALDSITKLSVSKTMNPEADVKCAKSITLSFGDNDFFSNKELTLTVSFKDSDCEEISKVAGTVVDWKDGKDLSKKKVKKK